MFSVWGLFLLFVICCVSCVGWCVPFAVCLSFVVPRCPCLLAVFRLLAAACSLMIVVRRCVLFAATSCGRCVLFIVCCVLCGVCCLLCLVMRIVQCLFVVCCSLYCSALCDVCGPSCCGCCRLLIVVVRCVLFVV